MANFLVKKNSGGFESQEQFDSSKYDSFSQFYVHFLLSTFGSKGAAFVFGG